ncbi:unnamed protein product [Trifolium pratense]|uniref:Uncharacterized protein n=1 Tax=Trifolium pratense TaxID=57577 RepID=A0ACB0IT41_TRIPR|nr:unnamed protein product [Trifolium pratense]
MDSLLDEYKNLLSNMKKLIGINKKKVNELLSEILEIVILDFFHQSTIKRRRGNRMTALINSNNDWVFEKTGLKRLEFLSGVLFLFFAY